MTTWEQQSKDLGERRQKWESTQNFNFIRALLESENEEEVKAAYVRQFSLPVKTGKRHDLTVNNVLFEFKYSVNFKNLEVAAKVVAQAIYYIHRLFQAGEEQEISHLIIADKDEAIIFKTLDFEDFYKSTAYDWVGYRPSSPDPKLVNHIKQSRLIESSRVYSITNEDDLSVFTNLFYRIVFHSKNNDDSSHTLKTANKASLKFVIYFVLIFVILGLASILVMQYRAELGDKDIPVETKR
ncbi:hypothetical protein SD80_027320 [Scytonema tolypothrichoides VB-61278]|nr:hypothetical protein SD80_027320 [Scytonema tolypothrichoides VB-61278]